MSWFVIAFDMYEKKQGRFNFVLLRLGSLSGFGCLTVWVDSGYKGCFK